MKNTLYLSLAMVVVGCLTLSPLFWWVKQTFEAVGTILASY